MSDLTNTILIGIDGGGTGCRVAITTATGAPLGTAKGGPANPTFKPEVALQNILAAIDAARLNAGLDDKALALAHAYIGLAGIRDAKIAKFIASSLPIKRVRVVEDTQTTVTGALAGKDGAVAAIGTGSFVALTTSGKTDYVGGWGFRLGDQASGAWLGHKLLRRVALCAEGVAEHTALTRETLAHYGDDASAIFDFSNTATPAEFGNLAPRVVAAASAGDQTGTQLMRSGADYIVDALTALDYQPGGPLCLAGGLGPRYADYLPSSHTVTLVKPKGTALDGALLLASQMGPAP